MALLAEGLLTEEDIDNMKGWAHSGFNVFVGDLIDSADRKRLLFAARYLKKIEVCFTDSCLVSTSDS